MAYGFASSWSQSFARICNNLHARRQGIKRQGKDYVAVSYALQCKQQFGDCHVGEIMALPLTTVRALPAWYRTTLHGGKG